MLLNTAAQGVDRTGVVQIMPQVPTQELIEASSTSEKQEGAIELLMDGIAGGTCGFSNHLRDWARHLAKYGVKVYIPKNRASEYPEIEAMHTNNHDAASIELLNYPGGGFPKKKNTSRTTIGYSIFETVKFPDNFIKDAENVDLLWTGSKFALDRFLQIGVDKEKVELFHEGTDIEIFNPYVQPSLNKRNTFIFGNVCGWSARKGIPELLEAFLREFDSKEGVALYISGGWYAKKVALEEVESMKKSIKNKTTFPEIVLDWSDRSDWEMPALFNSFDCLCYPTKGEGYGRPIVEAMSCGIPVIATDAPPMNELVSKSTGYPIVLDHVGPEPRADWITPSYKGADFFHPSVDHLRSLMREVFTHREEANNKAMKGREFVKKEHNTAFVIEKVVQRLLELKKG